MSSDFVTIYSSALPDDTRVAAFRAVEGLSRPYEIEVFLLAPSASLILDGGVGCKARLILDREDDKLPPFYFAGIFASLELLHEVADRTLVRGVIVPRFWQLGLSMHSRIFTKMTIVEIIQTVLAENAFATDEYELRLGSYSKEEHVCQYRESDLAFLSRWMEREGIYYFFEHTEDGEKLILSDDKSYDKDPVGLPVRYHPQSGADASAGASFRSFRCRHSTLPAKVRLTDYDYGNPNLDVFGTANVSDSSTGEVCIYGDRFFSPNDGKRLAQIRAEAFQAREVLYQAVGTRLHLRPGYVFELDEHPRAPFNTEYLALEVTHFGNQNAGGTMFDEYIDMPHNDVYLVEVLAMPAKKQYRAERTTPWPRIFGYENGIVDGIAQSEYAQIDEHGRYAVKFKFDENTQKPGRGSTYVRMIQPHGGSVEGFHFPLRKGTEVILNFLGGDPDRPVIIGVAPNALTPSPVTVNNFTRNIIQTGGRNALEFEDLAGNQWVHLSTPYETSYFHIGMPWNGTHELIMHTFKDGLLYAGANYDLRVGELGSGTWDAFIKNDWKTYVQNGGMSIGISLDPTPPSAGTFALDARTNIALHSTLGTYSLNVDAGRSTTTVKSDTSVTVEDGKYEHKVTGGPTTLKNTDNTTTIESKQKVTVESKDDAMDVLAKQAILMKSSDSTINIEAPQGDIMIKTPNKTITVDCTTFTDTSQDKKSNWGSVSDIATGSWTVYKLADWFEVGVSAKAEISISASLAFKLGVSLELGQTLNLEEKIFTKKDAIVEDVTALAVLNLKSGGIVMVNALGFFSTTALKIL